MSFGRRSPEVNSDGLVGTSRICNCIIPLDDMYELNDQLGLGLFVDISSVFDDIPVPDLDFVDIFAWDTNPSQVHGTPTNNLDTNSGSESDVISHYKNAKCSYSTTEGYAYNFVSSQRTHAFLGLKTSASPEPDSEFMTAIPESAQQTNTSQHKKLNNASDSDSQDNSVEYKLHYCRHRPCILGCQDKHSKMLWRDATTLTFNKSPKNDTGSIISPSLCIVRSQVNLGRHKSSSESENGEFV